MSNRYRLSQYPRRLGGLIRNKWVKAGLIAGLAGLLLIPAITYAHYAREIADAEKLMNRNNTGVVLLDKNGEVLYSYGKISLGEPLGLEDIADNLEQALIASEDQQFYEHPGYSVRGISRALYANILNKDPTMSGGSTLTQQLVKNTLLSNNKNFFRKYQELAIAVAIDRRYSKDEILEMYLNSVYFGEGAFGIQQAAKTYFNKQPRDLNLAESSMLVGLLPAPSSYSPISGDQAMAKQRQTRVLNLMKSAGYIKEPEQRQAAETQLSFAANSPTQTTTAQHYVQMVLDELNDRFGEENVIRNGFVVTTSLDLNWQRQAEEQVRRRVAELSRLGGNNAALVAVEAKTGEVRALVGSVDWDNPEFGKVNMATTPRQPGSSFKPIFYTEALKRRLITPASLLEDKRKTYGGTYSPQNYDFTYRGQVTTRQALAQSMNIPAVEVMQKLSPETAAKAAQGMGIDTVNEPEKYGLSLALGTAEASVLDMTSAYSALANSGLRAELSFINSVRDKYHSKVYRFEPHQRRVTTEGAAFLTSSILSDVNARGSQFSSLNIAGRQVAAKTGTTDKNHDAWTIGYTPQLSIGVWVGNNANQAMSGIAGAAGAGPIWRNTMQSFLQNMPVENFHKPTDIIEVLVCRSNGLRASNSFSGTYKEFFLVGSLPNGSCETPKPKIPPKKEENDRKEAPKEEKKEEGGRGGDGETTPLPAPEPEPEPAPEPEPTPTEPPPADSSGSGGGTSTSGPAPTP